MRAASGFLFFVISLVLWAGEFVVAEEISGTYSGDQGKLVFHGEGAVDIITTRKEIAEITDGGVKFGDEKSITVRGNYVVTSSKDLKEILQEIEGGKSALPLLERYSEGSGYKNWIIVTYPKNQMLLLAAKDRSLVSGYTGSVYRKAWYSR